MTQNLLGFALKLFNRKDILAKFQCKVHGMLNLIKLQKHRAHKKTQINKINKQKNKKMKYIKNSKKYFQFSKTDKNKCPKLKTQKYFWKKLIKIHIRP